MGLIKCVLAVNWSASGENDNLINREIKLDSKR